METGKQHAKRRPYLALPGEVVLLLPASVQGDQKVCAGVPVLEGETSIGHLLPGSYIDVSGEFDGSCCLVFLCAEFEANGNKRHTGSLRKTNGAFHRLGDGHIGGLGVCDVRERLE